MADFRARDYQRSIMGFVADHERCNIWAGMGTGKTVSVLTILQGLAMVEDPFPALVLAPLRVASTTWPGELQKWAHLEDLDMADWSGTRDFSGCVGASVVTCNYDNIEALVQHLGSAWPFRTVIADESTRLKSFRLRQGGKRAQALGRVAHKHTRRWVNLSGTPAPNGMLDLWGQQWFVDAGQRLGRSFHAYTDRWFRTNRPPGQRFGGEVTPMPGAQAEIEAKLADCSITVRAADFLDLPPLVENVIEVDLPPAARRHYRELEKDMFTVLAGGDEIEAVSAAAKSMKCLQAANGALYTDETGTYQEIHDAKIEALRSVVEEAAGTPVLVAYHFKSDLARLQRAFPQGRALGTDPAVVVDWNCGRISVLFAHPASAGHGLNLQDGGNIIAFFGLWWDLEQHEQIIERIGPTRQAQSGYDRPVFLHYIVAKGTIDKLVLARLKTKASMQSLLLEAMKGQR